MPTSIDIETGKQGIIGMGRLVIAVAFEDSASVPGQEVS